MIVSSLDLGTNTFRILISRNKNDVLDNLYYAQDVVRLGEGFSEYSNLSPQSIERSIKVLTKYKKNILKYSPQKIRAVATSVVRKAKNKKYFIQRVKDETGINVEIISQLKEAELTAIGVLKSLNKHHNNILIIDIGGGSTELILIRNNHKIDVLGINLGVVHVSEKYLKTNITTKEQLDLMNTLIKNRLNKVLSKFNNNEFKSLKLVATAGTPTTLASIILNKNNFVPAEVDGFVIEKYKLNEVYKLIVETPFYKRSYISGLEKGREDLIIPGIIILKTVMDITGMNQIVVSVSGLLEGNLYYLLD